MKTPRIRKTRLNADMRHKLKMHAKGLVRCPEESAASVAAKKALTDVTDALAAERFPEREMAVLLKYEMVHCQNLLETRREGNRGCEHLPLSKQFYMPHSGRHNSCHFAVELPADHPVWGLYGKHRAAVEKYQTAKSAKLEDYYALIDNCNTYEDVLAVWPEAEDLRASLRIQAPTALTVVSEDLLARIAADVKTREGRKALPPEPAAE